MGRVYDVPINEVGKEQIEKLIPKIKSLAPEVIISSPLLRTSQSAKIIGEQLNIPIEFDDRILEIDMGAFSGETHEDAARMSGATLEEFQLAYRTGTYDYIPWQGESFEQVIGRARDFLADLKGRPINNVLIVAHGGIIRSLYRAIENVEYPIDKDVPNAELIILDHE